MSVKGGLNIQHNVQLADYSTMGVKSIAKQFISIDDINEIPDIINYIESTHSDFLILGGGSNILFANDFQGLVIRNQIKGIEILKESESHVILKIGAGENWHSLVEKCVENEWYGIENLALIPGTVGAAPIQNIGAYGAEIVNVFVELSAFDIPSKSFKTYSKRECRFGYRDSIFKNELKNQVLITSVTLRLAKHGEINASYGALKTHLDQNGIDTPNIHDVYNAVIEVRRSKLPDPDEIGNNGSFFKNPVIPVFHYDELKQEYPEMPSYPVTEHLVKVPAGWLIDRAGWKGYRKGDAGVHAKQALVLVNYGQATGKELYVLSEQIKDDIESKYGISLVREVNVT
jgi:UDP-N-acetylmuramate dehydrogenase